MIDFRREGTNEEQIDASEDVDLSELHHAPHDSDGPPRPGRWRSFTAWCGETYKPVLLIVALGTGINFGVTAVRVWIHGVPNKAEVKQAVMEGVVEAIAIERARIAVLEERTAGLPERVAAIDATTRGPETPPNACHATRLTLLENTVKRHDDALDGMMFRDRRGAR